MDTAIPNDPSNKHPGLGRRKTRGQPKGRQVDLLALAEVRDLLGDRPRRPDLLIEHLHLIQDRYHALHARHLVALAQELRMALVEVYEVATFYAHFDVVMDGEEAPPPLTIRVCDSLTCALKGSDALLDGLAGAVGPEVRVIRAPCMGACHNAPAVAIGHALHEHATIETVTAATKEAVEAGHSHPHIPDYHGFDDYRAGGGYALLEECLNGTRDLETILTALEGSSLRGLGGAGFPTGRKWRFVRAEPGPRLMAINGDEGEPGTFKDRHYLETDPNRFLEGMLIGAWAVEATDVYVYLRDEYPQCREILDREIARVEAAGLSRHTKIHMRRGAGAYICGEESAMLESIEGKRGLPRHKPPFPSQVGLFGQPTLINNIETVFWVRDIVEKGPEWWSSNGRNGRKGLRSYSVSGRVKQPGVKLAPAGVTITELINEYCGGMEDGHAFKGYLPGGASGGILPASMSDIPLDFGTLEPHGCFIGSAAVVVLSDKDDMKVVGLNLLKFFEDESCGQCTPCRVGTEKAVKLLERPSWDQPLLGELAKVMTSASICGLGQAAMNPIKQIMKHFPEDLT
ncbi:NADH-quinone oxidoreductase subunit F [Skermanella stibiiresistens SB22]|uniref:NADH-quinone oxidoreductase subunit F n=1 Tax=Skermanella stibiiresistens SB22 TaxID=1385369 RepID=W9H345_9PROT|nr:NAD(P)H-dependent oxidoreductase subunit E [Skermanella stibiiresistens]EWY39127.1 NADH-quinone oxidoreductase subunit F [Skermanella stibiiresistens SB22]